MLRVVAKKKRGAAARKGGASSRPIAPEETPAGPGRLIAVTVAVVAMVGGAVWAGRMSARERREGGGRDAVQAAAETPTPSRPTPGWPEPRAVRAVTVPAEPPPAPPAAGADHVGRAVCATCHPKQAESFSKTNLYQSTALAVPGEVVGDFDSGQFVEFDGRRFTPEREGDAFFVRIRDKDGSEKRHPVKFRVGKRFGQRLIMQANDGRLNYAPVYWDVLRKRWRHEVDSGLAQPSSEDPQNPMYWGGYLRSFDNACAGCHFSQLEKGWDGEALRYDMAYVDPGVNCEACHGAGQPHLADVAAAGEDKEKIRAAAADDVGRVKAADRRAQSEVCARCHVVSMAVAGGFEPGGALLDHNSPVIALSGWYPDLTPKSYLYQYLPYAASRCTSEGGAGCASCHDPHGGSGRTALMRDSDDVVCGSCHAEIAKDPAAHDRHPRKKRSKSPPPRCSDCHMRKLKLEFVTGHHSHRIQRPVPELTLALEVPNACNEAGCHAEQDSAWASARAAEWWGDYQTAEVARARAFAAAWKGEQSGAETVARVATDAREPEGVRALAVASLTRLRSAEAVDAAEQALSDPSALVRSSALEVVGQWLSSASFPDQRAEPMLRKVEALLGDERRAVRRSALSVLVRRPGATVPNTPPARRAVSEVPWELGLTGENPYALVEMSTILRRTAAWPDLARSMEDGAVRLAATGPLLSQIVAQSFLDFGAVDAARRALAAPWGPTPPISVKGKLPPGLPPGKLAAIGIFVGAPTKPIRQVSVDPATQTSYELRDVPPGAYRVMGFVDENENGVPDPGIDRYFGRTRAEVQVLPGRDVTDADLEMLRSGR